MDKDYTTLKDGTTFKIQKDGTIVRDTFNSYSKQQNRKGLYCFLIILFFTTSIVFGILYGVALGEKEYYRESMRNAQHIINTAAEIAPLMIKDIEIGNGYKDGELQTHYGKKIYSYNTMYLKPQLSYVGLISGTKELKVKWYTPDGYLSRGDSSPEGFSLSAERHISKGDNTLTLPGWGNETQGQWDSGTYRVEIWYENTCLGMHTFEIY